MIIVVIQLNTKEIRDFLESQEYVYQAIYPPKEIGDIIAVCTSENSYMVWDNYEQFLNLSNIMKEEFNAQYEILNCEKDIEKFYEETRKKI